VSDTDVSPIEERIRGVSDGLLQAIREVSVREVQKRGVSPGDPSFPELATGVRVAAEVLVELARDEEQAAHELNAASESASLAPIDELDPPADLAVILAEWRAVERRLDAADAGSLEALDLVKEFEAARDRYARALERLQPRSRAGRGR
jgi:hypothetical protein